ncbi:Seipin-2 [Nymphaea thermarum]|nr:Seipin-2 [Nymphaea thermarum]
MAEIPAEGSHPDLFLDALDVPLPSLPNEVTGNGVGSPGPVDEFFDSRPDPSYRPSPRNLRRRFPSRRIEFHRSSGGDGSDASNVEETGGIVGDGGKVIGNLRISEPSSSRVDSSAVTGLSEGPLVSEVSVVPASNGDVFRTRKESGCDKGGQDNELHELSVVSSGSKDWSEDGHGDDGGKPEASPLKIETSEILKDSGFSETVGSHGNIEEPVSESHVNADYTNRLALVECSGEELSGSSLDVAHGLPPNILISIAGFVIKVIGFQINLLVMFLVFPIKSSYYLYKLVTDPFGTVDQIKDRGVNVLGQVSNYVWERIGANFIDQTTIRKLVKMFGWGFLWSSYVGFVLFSFFILSFILSSVLMGSFLEKPIRMTKPLSFDYTVSDPEALVPINAVEGIDYMQYCKGNVKAEKSEGRRFIPPYHKLQLTISLTLPESEYNRKLGVFQVTVDFLSANGKVLASSGHPCMLRFKSDKILLVGTLLKGVPLLVGYSSESQTIKVRMTGFVEGIDPSTCLKVALKHRAECRPGEGIPEIYSASILLESELPLLKRILWSWRRTIFIWVAAGFFVMELFLILICCGHIIFPRPRPTHDAINLREASFQSIDSIRHCTVLVVASPLHYVTPSGYQVTSSPLVQISWKFASAMQFMDIPFSAKTVSELLYLA